MYRFETFSEQQRRQRRKQQLKEALFTVIVLAVGFGFIAILAEVWP